MKVFQIENNDQEQFAELPEIAMDLNFGRLDSNTISSGVADSPSY